MARLKVWNIMKIRGGILELFTGGGGVRMEKIRSGAHSSTLPPHKKIFFPRTVYSFPNPKKTVYSKKKKFFPNPPYNKYKNCLLRKEPPMTEKSWQTQVLQFLNTHPEIKALKYPDTSLTSKTGQADIFGSYQGKYFELELKLDKKKYPPSQIQLLALFKTRQKKGVGNIFYYSKDWREQLKDHVKKNIGTISYNKTKQSWVHQL